MDLWIRSQDRDYLEKVEKIYVWGNSPDGYVIESKGELGTYKSKERALEVLDEIQIRIINNEILKTMILKLNNVKGEEEKIGKLFKEMVYEMPKE